MKGLNAYHASPEALANAAPNSQVGKLAAYRDAARATETAEADLDEAGKALVRAGLALSDAQHAIDVRTRRRDAGMARINAKIAALDPSDSDYDARRDQLKGEKAALTTSFDADMKQLDTEFSQLQARNGAAEETYDAAKSRLRSDRQAEGAALHTATGGRTLSPAALRTLREWLGL
ncbi:hypothetical protein [Acidimangrovimonas sediminis]|uniref:hypothetical protein n=1 Tax=Acidimangrovimonas sediminis TaxID=2056283 RepID=UPI001304E1E4|nr:hypothetical protein [Acidimangrovimonas sediminis]